MGDRASDIAHELTFWREKMKAPTDDIHQRLNRNRWNEACPATILRFVSKDLDNPMLILDVGSGPLSQIAYVTTYGHALLGLDPLANEYKEILKANKLTRNCVLIEADAEADNDMRIFKGEADIVWCRNALDHCVWPSAAAVNMALCLAPGGVLIISGFVNEGKFQHYQGMHKTDIFRGKDGIPYFSSHGSIDQWELMPFEGTGLPDDLSLLSCDILGVSDRPWIEIIWRRAA